MKPGVTEPEKSFGLVTLFLFSNTTQHTHTHIQCTVLN